MVAIVGIAWLIYSRINAYYSSYLTSMDSSHFDWVNQHLDDWVNNEANYMNQLLGIGRGVAGVVGQLPTPIVYLFSIGFTLFIVAFMVRIVMELL